MSNPGITYCATLIYAKDEPDLEQELGAIERLTKMWDTLKGAEFVNVFFEPTEMQWCVTIFRCAEKPGVAYST